IVTWGFLHSLVDIAPKGADVDGVVSHRERATVLHWLLAPCAVLKERSRSTGFRPDRVGFRCCTAGVPCWLVAIRWVGTLTGSRATCQNAWAVGGGPRRSGPTGLVEEPGPMCGEGTYLRGGTLSIRVPG